MSWPTQDSHNQRRSRERRPPSRSQSLPRPMLRHRLPTGAAAKLSRQSGRLPECAGRHVPKLHRCRRVPVRHNPPSAARRPARQPVQPPSALAIPLTWSHTPTSFSSGPWFSGYIDAGGITDVVITTALAHRLTATDVTEVGPSWLGGDRRTRTLPCHQATRTLNLPVRLASLPYYSRASTPSAPSRRCTTP